MSNFKHYTCNTKLKYMLQKENIQIGEGGEILSAKITTLKKVTAEQFCQIYLQDNEEFFTLTKSESNLLSVCWLMSTYYEDKDLKYPGNRITCNKQFKNIVNEKTGLAESTIRNSLVSLVKKEMLIKDSEYKGVYYLNPKYFFKGKISDRTKLIKHTIEYQIV